MSRAGTRPDRDIRLDLWRVAGDILSVGLRRPASFARWHNATPEDFFFAVKGSRFITHSGITQRGSPESTKTSSYLALRGRYSWMLGSRAEPCPRTDPRSDPGLRPEMTGLFPLRSAHQLGPAVENRED